MRWGVLGANALIWCVVLCCGCVGDVPVGGATSRSMEGDSVMVGDSVGVPGGVSVAVANDGEWGGLIEY